MAYEMICEFKSRKVGVGVFEVDDHELFMMVDWEEKR